MFYRYLEDSYSLWQCLKVQKEMQSGIAHPRQEYSHLPCLVFSIENTHRCRIQVLCGTISSM